MTINKLMRGAFLNRVMVAANDKEETAAERGVKAERGRARRRLPEDRLRGRDDPQRITLSEAAEHEQAFETPQLYQAPDILKPEEATFEHQQPRVAPDAPMPREKFAPTHSIEVRSLRPPKQAADLQPFKRASGAGQQKRMYIARQRKRTADSRPPARVPAILRDQ